MRTLPFNGPSLFMVCGQVSLDRAVGQRRLQSRITIIGNGGVVQQYFRQPRHARQVFQRPIRDLGTAQRDELQILKWHQSLHSCVCDRQILKSQHSQLGTGQQINKPLVGHLCITQEHAFHGGEVSNVTEVLIVSRRFNQLHAGHFSEGFFAEGSTQRVLPDRENRLVVLILPLVAIAHRRQMVVTGRHHSMCGQLIESANGGALANQSPNPEPAQHADQCHYDQEPAQRKAKEPVRSTFVRVGRGSGIHRHADYHCTL